MIDGTNRVIPIYKNNSRLEEHEYPQVEIKILRFINSLNKQAITNGGRIYKLLGNHEIMNIEGIASKFYFENDKLLHNNYFIGKSRNDIFKIGNYGFNLLFEDSCRALLMINKYIFVHGQLIKNKNFYYYDDINRKIKTNNSIQSAIIELSNQVTSQLWVRAFGADENIKIRADLNYQNLQNNKSKTYKEIEYDSNFCKNDITEYFNSFLSGLKSTKYTSADLKIVIGHCVQSDNTFFNSPATSLTTIEYQDPIRQILTGPAKNSLYNSKDNLIFGITMECPHNTDPNSTKYKIHKVDIGSSRMFDQKNAIENIKNIEDEKKYLFSRTPQVLEFINDNTKIIKSQIKNTRIHQPRFFYNNKISNIPELQFTNTSYYKQKYIKYKTKYISLKNIK
jgi:hypothetical protein